ncbi:MAG: beta strand repeat-containing protein [Mariniblastus sp.]
MNLFKSKNKRDPIIESPDCNSGSLGDASVDGSSADIGYIKLEPRQVLSASFVFGAGGLLLDGFDAGQDLSFGQQNAVVNGVSQDAYIFTVDSGSWTGSTANPLVELESINGGADNQLQVATAFFGNDFDASLAFNGLITGANNQVGISQLSPSFTFDTLEIENFTNVDQSIELNTTGDIFTGDLTVADSNPDDNVNPAAQIRITTTGTIEVTDDTAISNEINSSQAGISIQASGSGNDVFVSGTLESATGDIEVAGQDEVRMRTSGSVIDAGNGRVTLNSISGNTSVGAIMSQATGDAISIDSAAGILDNSTNETTNLSASNGRIVLDAVANIGAAGVGDIDIESQFLEFNTDGPIHLTDSAFGLTIDRNSSAASGSIVASGDVTVDANLNFDGAVLIESGNDLVIANNSVISNFSSVTTLDTNARFVMEEFSRIDANAGRVIVNSNGTAAISQIRSDAAGDAIVVNAGQSIVDATGAESANLRANNGRIVLTSNDNIGIAGVGDIDIQTELVSFTARNEIALSDVSGGLNIDDDSFAGNGFVQTVGTLTISANVGLNGQMDFIASDNLIIDDNVAVTQNSNDRLRFSTNEFRMVDGSRINSAGQVVVNATSDVLLSRINSAASDNAVVVNSSGSIVDNTALELENISTVNGRTVLNAAGNIGGENQTDIDVRSQRLRFNTPGEIVLTDLDQGIEIDQTSSANRATIQSTGNLVISADVGLNASSEFTTISSGSVNDDIRIENGSIVSLSSSVDAVVNFTAADDVIFDTGQVVTSGGGTHQVILSADNEDAIDSDRGSVSNASGSGPSIITNNLEITAYDGIGDSTNGLNQPLRVDVETLVALNTGSSDIRISEADAIELTNVQTADGAISITTGGDIFANNVVAGETEPNEDNADNLSLISTNGSISLLRILASDDLYVNASNGEIIDDVPALIDVDRNAWFVADTLIQLADNDPDFLRVVGNATFDADRVVLGQDRQSPGSGGSTTSFGSVTIIAENLVLIENDAIEFSGINNFDELYVFTNQTITNTASTILNVTGHLQLNAGAGIVLGNQVDDSINLGSLGVVTDNAHIELDSSVVIAASFPDQDIANFGLDISQGTEVSNTLFLASTGSIEQNADALNVANLGLAADEHVHLASVSQTNQSVAINAGTSTALSDAVAIETIQALANLENSEVNAGLEQSIAIRHEGQLNVTTVNSHFDSASVVGLQTTDGSIFATSVGELSIRDNIVARSPDLDPQATIYSQSGNATTPGVLFEGGQIEVIGNSNAGIVNANQTFANFFGDDGFVIRGTTEILVLNTDGSADQDIVLDYGHTGEQGYRVGIVWDKDNRPGSPAEVINTFVSGPNIATEAFDDDVIYRDNPTTFHPFSGQGGERVTLPKIGAYSKEAVILHQDVPNVFSTITVRNDQDINLFTGSLASASNALNETDQTLRAEFDAPKKAVPNIPRINPINPIEIKTTTELPISSSAPETSNTLTFDRDVQPFETGDLKWVQVSIPLSNLEEFGNEVRIKDPTKVFPKSDDAETNELPDQIGENEVEKIIDEIESSKKAEPGYWYKVFKDYQNRDDELFFYHLKTGDMESGDSKFDNLNENQELEKANPIEPESTPKERPGSDFEPNSGSQLDADTDASFPIQQPETTHSTVGPHSLSAAGLMAATLLLQRTKIQSDPTKSEDDEPINPKPEPKFSRLARMKRKIKNALNSIPPTDPS